MTLSNATITKRYVAAFTEKNCAVVAPHCEKTATMIGQFVGYRIVEAWLQKNKGMSLDKVMRTPAKIIFEQAKYKP